MDTLPNPEFTSPPSWSLATGEAGRIFAILAGALFILATLIWIVAAKKPLMAKWGRILFQAGALATLATFVSLAILFVNNRFEFEYVWGHSDSKNPIVYSIAGIWSGQEGSFLLWALCSALFGLIVVRATKQFERGFTIVYSAFLAFIMSIVCYESPFKLNLAEGKPIVPVEGLGLSPALQNYWVTIHPPVIFLGFGALTVLFAFAMAAMIIKDYDGWIPLVRPWAIAATTLVGVGLCMGGFWAYETLGWGGFWMWDPVENVSFVPWCLCAAFIHGILVQTVKKKWQFGNLLFAALPFLTFVYGTFLTRSGVLADTSVHSFAEMDRSALRLLVGLLGASFLSFMGFWIVRRFQFKADTAQEAAEPKGLRRESLYLLGSLLLTGLSVATLIGMSVPFLKAMSGQTVAVVEERTYHLVVPWLFIPLMLAMAIAPVVSWKAMPWKNVVGKSYAILCVTVGLIGFIMMSFTLTPYKNVLNLGKKITFPFDIQANGLAWVTILLAICLFALVGNAWRVYELRKASKMGLFGFVSHVGIAVLMAGLIVSRGFEQRDEAIAMENHPTNSLGYGFEYKGMTSNTSDRDNKVIFDVTDMATGKPLFQATPGLYFVETSDGRKNPMVWPHIERGWFHDTYIALGPPQDNATEPFAMAKNETKTVGGLKLTFLGMERIGGAGTAGTRFAAKIRVDDGTNAHVIKPSLELSGVGEPVGHPADLDSSIVASLVGMDAGKGAVTLQLGLKSPMYPIEVFHKPLTSLVWLGTFLMMVGGFGAAVYRRVPAARRVAAETSDAPEPRPKKILVTS